MLRNKFFNGMVRISSATTSYEDKGTIFEKLGRRIYLDIIMCIIFKDATTGILNLL